MNIKIKRPKAVIFDMDGVLIDSMPYHFIAWYEALRPYGVRVSCFDVYAKEGERWERTLVDLLSRKGINPTARLLKEIFRKRQLIFKHYFKRFIFQGAEELLRSVKRGGFTLGLVTGTPINEIRRILPRSIRSLFDCVISGDQVKKGKPHPEPYLTAAKRLQVKPKECLVIENAPFGIISAQKAGMFCIAVTTSLPKEYLNADLVVDSLSEVQSLVERWG
jgi:beta-phosphoglucomutase